MLIYHPTLKCFDWCAAYFCQNYFPFPISHRYWNFRIVFAKETWWVLNSLLNSNENFQQICHVFFQIILSFNKSATGWFLQPPPHVQKGKEKDHAETGFIWDFFCKLASNQKQYCLLEQSCFTWMLSTKFSRMLLLTGTANIILMFSGEAVHCCTLLSDFLNWCWDCWLTQRANDRYKVSYSREVCGSGSGVGV